MKLYDHWNKYPYNAYGNCVLLSDRLDYHWMESNLTHSQPKYQEDYIGANQYFVGYIIGFQCWEGSGGVFYSFHDLANKEAILRTFPEKVIASDPFGPDLCPKCSETTTHWMLFVAACTEVYAKQIQSIRRTLWKK